ncbi:unnamed protein product [Alopecurus aequalis]
MQAGSASSRKRKSAALESTSEAPAPVAVGPRAGEGDGGVGGGADRLSSLPDALLGEIISLLTTKEGARTRILASRWRDLWLSAPLNLDCRQLTASHRVTVRADVVAHILSSHHGPGRRLYVDTYRFNIPADTVEACLRSTALDNLEELDFIDHRLEQPHRALLFRFWRTLRVANIGRCDLSDVSFQGLHFPLLQQLGLVYVTISECSLHTLIAGCPALECLLIYRTIGVCCLRINSLTIRSVSVLSDVIPPVGVLRQVVIENAPRLQRLLLLDPGVILHVSVVTAPQLETLGFIGDMNHWDEFSTLVLGSTVIQSRESRPGNLWRRKHRNLIRCLDLRLKTIVLTKYKGLKSQVNFVTFFILNARLLESVTLGIKDRNNNEKFFAEQQMKLQIQMKASKDVRLHFTTETCVQRFYYMMDVRDYDLADPFAHI